MPRRSCWSSAAMRSADARSASSAPRRSVTSRTLITTRCTSGIAEQVVGEELELAGAAVGVHHGELDGSFQARSRARESPATRARGAAVGVEQLRRDRARRSPRAEWPVMRSRRGARVEQPPSASRQMIMSLACSTNGAEPVLGAVVRLHGGLEEGDVRGSSRRSAVGSRHGDVRDPDLDRQLDAVLAACVADLVRPRKGTSLPARWRSTPLVERLLPWSRHHHVGDGATDAPRPRAGSRACVRAAGIPAARLST
jgi:hypothetical protein